MKRIALLAVLTVFSVTSFADVAETAKPEKKPTEFTIARIVTSKGDIWIELNAEKAPITVKNFEAYVKDGFYNDTIFHRVMKGFMIQGGGMTANMQKKPTKAPIKNEASNGLKNKRGTIAMARTNVPDSATSQFFINHKDNPALDFRDPSPRGIGYAVFGKVVKGMDVVDAIAEVKTTRKGMHGNVPVEPVTIKSITVAYAAACADGKKCENCEHKAECKKDCDNCPKKGTKDCPKENGTCCCKKKADAAKPAEK